MRILILGNGFDLAHNLATKYTDFLDFVDFFLNYKKGTFSSGVNRSDMGYSDVICRDIVPMVSDFKDNYVSQICETEMEHNHIQKTLEECLIYNKWIKYFSKTRKAKGWAGFEAEISKVIQCLDASRKAVKYHEPTKQKRITIDYKEYPFMRSLFNDNQSDMPNKTFTENQFGELIEDALADLEKLIISFEIYLAYFVEKQKVMYRIPNQDIDMASVNCILSFNYTNTYERIYGNENTTAQYDYIHGKSRHGFSEFHGLSTNIILGIDEYLDEQDRNHDITFIRFKKFFQRIYKKTSVDYIEWIKALQEKDAKDQFGLNELYFYGHSLSVTDGDIIQDLLNIPNVFTTIFYYSEEMYAQQIENLVQIIGENKLIAAVNHKKIEFKKQSPLIPNNS